MGDDRDHGEDIRAQAANWFARLKTVPTSIETIEGFFAWRRVDSHRQAYEEIERAWTDTGSVADRPAIRAATDAAYARGVRERRPFGIGKAITAIAGVLAVGGVALFFGLSRLGDSYATGVGEQSVITLEDGSKVTLDTDTKVEVRYSKADRAVNLDHGQALFSVAHQPGRPFTVSADDTEVLATGTRFEVRRIGSETDVTLVEGSVRVSSPGADASRLRAGEQFRLRAAEPAGIRTVDTAIETAWTSGRIVFNGATLAEAIGEVNRYTRKPIRLDASRYAEKQFSGTFQTGDVASFVAAATALLPVRAVAQSDGSITLMERESATIE